MKKIIVFLLIFSAFTTMSYATKVYYTFSPFSNLQGIGVIMNNNKVYGNLDVKANYEKHIEDSFRPTLDKDFFFWDYSFNIGGGYKHNSFLFGAEIGYLNRTKTFMYQFEDATTNTGQFLYGLNFGLVQHKLFFGVKIGNIELVSFKIGVSF